MLHVSVIIAGLLGFSVNGTAVRSIEEQIASFRELRALVNGLDGEEASNEQNQRRLSCEISVLEGLYDESNDGGPFVLPSLPVGCTIEEAQDFLGRIGAHSGSTDFVSLISEALVSSRSELFELQAESVELSYNLITQRQNLQRAVVPLCQELDHAKRKIEKSIRELSRTIQELLEEVRIALDREGRLMAWIESTFEFDSSGPDSNEELEEFVEDYMDGAMISLTERLNLDRTVNRRILQQVSSITASAIARVRRELESTEMDVSIKETELEFIQSYLNEVSEIFL